jgi:hypothetical protein
MLRRVLGWLAPPTRSGEAETTVDVSAVPFQFKLKPNEIAPVAVGRGGCIASDRITVDGSRVGYMYRGVPNNALDSGWRFLAGDETEEYMADSKRHAVYDLNTIVNYDPDILPFLDAEEGSEFERGVGGVLERIEK